jgi:hypothetical protein
LIVVQFKLMPSPSLIDAELFYKIP